MSSSKNKEWVDSGGEAYQENFNEETKEREEGEPSRISIFGTFFTENLLFDVDRDSNRQV